MSGCPSCGHMNQAGAKFCSQCGVTLAPAKPTVYEERKVVTVLFADLVGFTSRAEQMDPEDVRAVLSPYYLRLRSELERFGGTVEKFIGDAVMALFGAPVAHEDDPERAVRAALAIRDWVREEGIQVRLAVNTGDALVTVGARPTEGEGMAAGDVVNTAARLQAAAPVNGILVGERTYRATRQAIVYRDADPVVAKGKEQPVPVWEAVQARAQLGVDVPAEARTALAGRQRELDVLRDALLRVRAERLPQLVTLVGVPGIGKSRLLFELSRIVDAEPEFISWRQGRSLPYGEGVSFWAVAEIVKAQAGILESDAASEAAGKLSGMVGDLLSDGQDADWVRRNLASLVGLEGNTVATGPTDRTEVFAAWRRFFEALAEARPLVLVFEDLHWADDGVLDFVDYLVDWAGEVPILVVCSARPELLERRSGWGGGKPNAVTLSLAPLSDDDTAALIRSLLGRPVLDAEQQQALLAHAGGNPLYAEQYVQMVAEGGSAQDLALPETVQGVLGARLDRLSLAEKQTLQDAAVIGKVFWPGAVDALGGKGDRAPLDERLHGLARKQFVRRERRSSVAGEDQYAFLHVLLRDVAYGQIPRTARIDKHVRTAHWIESLGRPEEHAEMLAHHYLSALDLARAANQDVAELAPRARLALRAAGERAQQLNAFGSAAGYLRAALDLWPEEARAERAVLQFRLAQALRDAGEDEDGAALEDAQRTLLAVGDRPHAAAASARLAQHWWFKGQRDRCFDFLQQAEDLVRDEPPSTEKAYVLSELARFQMLAGEPAVQTGREAFELAERFGLDELRAHNLITIGTTSTVSGDEAGVDEIRRGLDIALAGNYLSTAIRGYSNLAAFIEQARGDLREALQLQLEAETVATRLGTRDARRWTRGNMILLLLEVGEWERCAHEADQFLAESAAHGAHYHDAAVHSARAWLRVGHGAVDAALEDGTEALASARSVKDPQVLAPVLASLSHLLVVAGRLEAAEPLLDELVAMEGTNANRLSSNLIDCIHAAEALGRRTQVRDLVERSRESAWRSAARSLLELDFDRAAATLDTIGAARSAAFVRLAAGHTLTREHRTAEAAQLLSGARDFFASAGAVRFLREAEALLRPSA